MADNVMSLEEAAMSGDIDRLYALIEENPDILNDLDEERLLIVKTPLHIAASVDLRTNPNPGQELTYLYFATEIMVLKPSFALKLNPQGLSPLHLAIKNGHSKLARRFVEMNKDLVRVKGREGTTPLHLVSQIGDCDLLAYFLSACPDSIKDVNTRDETALHVAVRYQRFDALSVLVGWLTGNTRMSAENLESSILNWRDVAGNTILHLSVINHNTQALNLLIRNQNIIYLNVKNSENNTALDEAASSEDMKRKLYKAGARPGSSLQDDPTETPVYRLISKSRPHAWDPCLTYMKRVRGNISDNQRDAYLVAATLFLTTIYQSALSPPGGLYQADASNRNAAGKSVLNGPYLGPNQLRVRFTNFWSNRSVRDMQTFEHSRVAHETRAVRFDQFSSVLTGSIGFYRFSPNYINDSYLGPNQLGIRFTGFPVEPSGSIQV
ncbi:hypothetical protein PIB30_066657 [Stylosanthes scabra]|uniref:Uncharacterized protein n=1 Tax=Stylosanthes scabra TaxID=79078 RepID=A0ABU6SMH0_9FABA|nr:hypothetical protein [Stylosanthes scabra]